MLSGFCAPPANHYIPIVAVYDYLVAIKLPVKASPNLGLAVAVEAEHGEVGYGIVRRVFIDVMDLDGLTLAPTYTTSAIRQKQDAGSYMLWYLSAFFFRHSDS